MQRALALSGCSERHKRVDLLRQWPFIPSVFHLDAYTSNDGFHKKMRNY